MLDLRDLLDRTSRTFALAIPFLPEPTFGQVGCAYLLFRIADTFEDAAIWRPEKRVLALEDFGRLLERRLPEEALRLTTAWTAEPPLEHDGYLKLLRSCPDVLDFYWNFAVPARSIVGSHLSKTVRGMAAFVARSGEDGRLCLRDLSDLREYCYTVAGNVGEMLTEIFLLGHPALEAKATGLRERSRAFGEGLQLTNILKDASADAVEGRHFLPSDVSRETVLDLAREDLLRAAEYVAALERAKAPRGLIAFTALPVLLARATLDRIEAHGPGSKVSRLEVYAIVNRLNRALDRGEPAVPETSGTTTRAATGGLAAPRKSLPRPKGRAKDAGGAGHMLGEGDPGSR